MPGLIETIIKAGSANSQTFAHGYEGAFTGGYFIAHDPKELARLATTLRTWAPYSAALSIGMGAGGADRFLVESLDIRELVVIDDGEEAKAWAANKEGMQIPVHEYLGKGGGKKAGKSPAKFLAELGLKFNLVGIDGGHSIAAMKTIWGLIAPYLAPGCVVWFHDIASKKEGENGAAELWFYLRRHYPVLQEDRKTPWGIGVIRV